MTTNKKNHIIKKLLTILLLAIFVLPVSLASAHGHSYESPPAVHNLLRDTRDAQRIPVISVGIIQPNGIAYYFVGDMGDGAPSTLSNIDTYFYMASLSKAFTALAILLLQHDNLLSITDPIIYHIPFVNFTYRDSDFCITEVTIKSLLQHSSGLTNMRHSVAIRPSNDAYAMYNAVRQISDMHLSFRPNTRSDYGSANYITLGLIVESVSGVPFENFIIDRILTPLNITGIALCRYDILNRGAALAIGSRHEWFRSTPHELPQWRSHIPTGFMLGNARGLSQWLSFHLNPQNAPYPFNTLMPQMLLVNQSIEPFSDAYGNKYRYGLGWYVSVEGTHIRHPGFAPNVTSEGFVCFYSNTTIVILKNSVVGAPLNLRRNIQTILLGEQVSPGDISSGSFMRALDTTFSSITIALIVVSIALFILAMIMLSNILKKRRKFNKLNKKQIIKISVLGFLVLLSVLITTLAPTIIGFGSWTAIMIWVPSSLYGIMVTMNIAIFLLAVLLGLKAMFKRLPEPFY